MSILGKSNRDRVYLSKKFTLDAKFVQDSFILHVDALSLNRLPDSGGCILLCNRPIGALEELLLESILPSHCKEKTAFYDNPFLSSHDGMGSKMILRNDERSQEDIARLKHRVNVIFPAGVLSKRRNHKRAKVDGRWNRQTIRHLMALDLPIYPVLIEGRAETAGRVLSSFHSVHRTTQILVTALQEEKNEVTIHIGPSIDKKQLQCCANEGQLTRLLRSKLFSLGTPIKVEDYFFNEGLTKQPLAKPIRQDVLLREKKALDQDHLLFESEDYIVYLFYALDAPNWIQEIGRLRALNDRLSGKECNQPRRLDELDLYHEHLAIWGVEEKRIVASCRIGDGKRVYATHGKSGLSLDKMFRLNPSFDGLLKKSIDLDCFCIDHGLSKDNLLLTLLWSGIKTILSDRPYLSYLSSLSPLQITENNDSVSKAIEVFVRERKDEALASYVEIKDRKQDVDMNSVSTVDEGQKTASFTSHPIDFPAPAPIAYAIQQHAKVLSVTRDENQPSHEVKALLWMAVQDLPE
ncbi:MAG: GNAT family N-acyltransferase [Chitinophagales bacterium]